MSEDKTIMEYDEDESVKFIRKSLPDKDIEIDEDELLDSVIKNARKDKIRDFTDEQIEAIVAGELAYCDTLNLFE